MTSQAATTGEMVRVMVSEIGCSIQVAIATSDHSVQPTMVSVTRETCEVDSEAVSAFGRSAAVIHRMRTIHDSRARNAPITRASLRPMTQPPVLLSAWRRGR